MYRSGWIEDIFWRYIQKGLLMGLKRFRKKETRTSPQFFSSVTVQTTVLFDTGKTRKGHGGGRVESRSAGGEIKRSVLTC